MSEVNNALSHIRLTRIEQTCEACPAQWDAWDADGTYYYIRFRWGFLSVNRGEGWNDRIFGAQISDELDGWMSQERMLELTGMVAS